MSPPRLEVLPGIFRDPDSNVVELASESAVDAAWAEFSRLAARLPGHPELLSDRAFMEDLKRAERKWTRLFNMADGGDR